MSLAHDGKRKRGGRVKVETYDPAGMEKALELYVKQMGVDRAFDLGSYKAMPVSYAARGHDLVKLHKLVMAILMVLSLIHI